MIDGNANPNVGSSPTQNSLHRSSPSCPPDKSDSENKNFRTRVRVWYVWRSNYEKIPVFSFYVWSICVKTSVKSFLDEYES